MGGYDHEDGNSDNAPAGQVGDAAHQHSHVAGQAAQQAHGAPPQHGPAQNPEDQMAQAPQWIQGLIAALNASNAPPQQTQYSLVGQETYCPPPTNPGYAEVNRYLHHRLPDPACKAWIAWQKDVKQFTTEAATDTQSNLSWYDWCREAKYQASRYAEVRGWTEHTFWRMAVTKLPPHMRQMVCQRVQAPGFSGFTWDSFVMELGRVTHGATQTQLARKTLKSIKMKGSENLLEFIARFNQNVELARQDDDPVRGPMPAQEPLTNFDFAMRKGALPGWAKEWWALKSPSMFSSLTKQVRETGTTDGSLHTKALQDVQVTLVDMYNVQRDRNIRDKSDPDAPAPSQGGCGEDNSKSVKDTPQDDESSDTPDGTDDSGTGSSASDADTDSSAGTSSGTRSRGDSPGDFLPPPKRRKLGKAYTDVQQWTIQNLEGVTEEVMDKRVERNECALCGRDFPICDAERKALRTQHPPVYRMCTGIDQQKDAQVRRFVKAHRGGGGQTAAKGDSTDEPNA
jgi:hypothetical protein